MRFTILIVLAAFAISPAFSDETTTSPTTLVDVKIMPSSNEGEVIIEGVRLFHETIAAAYHLNSDRGRRNSPDMSRRQDVSIFQSELKRIPTRFYRFNSVDGAELTLDEVQARLKERPVLLILPVGASLHPGFKSILDGNAVVATRLDVRPTPQRSVLRPDAG